MKPKVRFIRDVGGAGYHWVCATGLERSLRAIGFGRNGPEAYRDWMARAACPPPRQTFTPAATTAWMQRRL